MALSADRSQPSIIIHQLTFGPLASFSKEPRDATVLNSCQIPSIPRPQRRRPRPLYLLLTRRPSVITEGIDFADPAFCFGFWRPLRRSHTPPPPSEYKCDCRCSLKGM